MGHVEIGGGNYQVGIEAMEEAARQRRDMLAAAEIQQRAAQAAASASAQAASVRQQAEESAWRQQLEREKFLAGQEQLGIQNEWARQKAEEDWAIRREMLAGSAEARQAAQEQRAATATERQWAYERAPYATRLANINRILDDPRSVALYPRELIDQMVQEKNALEQGIEGRNRNVLRGASTGWEPKRAEVLREREEEERAAREEQRIENEARGDPIFKRREQLYGRLGRAVPEWELEAARQRARARRGVLGGGGAQGYGPEAEQGRGQGRAGYLSEILSGAREAGAPLGVYGAEAEAPLAIPPMPEVAAPAPEGAPLTLEEEVRRHEEVKELKKRMDELTKDKDSDPRDFLELLDEAKKRGLTEWDARILSSKHAGVKEVQQLQENLRTAAADGPDALLAYIEDESDPAGKVRLNMSRKLELERQIKHQEEVLEDQTKLPPEADVKEIAADLQKAKVELPTVLLDLARYEEMQKLPAATKAARKQLLTRWRKEAAEQKKNAERAMVLEGERKASEEQAQQQGVLEELWADQARFAEKQKEQPESGGRGYGTSFGRLQREAEARKRALTGEVPPENPDVAAALGSIRSREVAAEVLRRARELDEYNRLQQVRQATERERRILQEERRKVLTGGRRYGTSWAALQREAERGP